MNAEDEKVLLLDREAYRLSNILDFPLSRHVMFGVTTFAIHSQYLFVDSVRFYDSKIAQKTSRGHSVLFPRLVKDAG